MAGLGAESEDGDDVNWNFSGILRLSTIVFSHPFDYVKFLVQIGHEPLPPTPCVTWLSRRPALSLPNVFKYADYIRKTDGFFGLYRGLLPKLCGSLVHGAVYGQMNEFLADDEKCPSDDLLPMDEQQKTIEDRITECFNFTSRIIVSRCAAITISQPFTVIALRSMAQFVGKETTYSSLYSSIKEIYNQEGLSGFFSGLLPKLMGEVMSILITTSVCLIVDTYILTDKEFKSYSFAGISFLTSTLTYPFQLVSSIMTVNNANLTATSYPHMTKYIDWSDCWSHLSEMGQLKRGSSLLWRYYTGPTLLHADGKLGPAMPSKFKQSFGVVGALHRS